MVKDNNNAFALNSEISFPKTERLKRTGFLARFLTFKYHAILPIRNPDSYFYKPFPAIKSAQSGPKMTLPTSKNQFSSYI
jgi:hypothetical protein